MTLETTTTSSSPGPEVTEEIGEIAAKGGRAEEEESICIGSVDPRQALHGRNAVLEEVGGLVARFSSSTLARVHVGEPNNKQRSGESSASPSPFSPSVISRGGSRRVDSAPASRLASSFASRGAKGLVSPRRAVYRGRVQAAVRNFLERLRLRE